VETEDDPLRVSVCHCFACQQRTGSAFGVQARFARERTSVSGPSTAYVRTGDSGGKSTFHFCPTCGSTVYYELEGIPDAIAIPVGAFADSTFPGPKIAVFEVRRHPWVTIEGLAEHHD
jgi:hypothetical protein